LNKDSYLVVLHYNKIRLTQRCLKSILDAGYNPQHVYCFDNGSQPEVFLELQKNFSSCNHLRIDKNLGFSGGFNRALEWIFSTGVSSALFCTNDTIIGPNAVEACIKTAAKTRAELVAPLVTFLNKPDAIDSIGAFFDNETGSLFHYHDYGLPEILNPDRDYIPGTAVWIHRDAFRELGGTDESFFMFWEDVDLCFRAHKKGISLARCYQSLVKHGGGQSTRKKPLYTTFYFQRNRIRFCKRYLDGDLRNKVLNQIRNNLLHSGNLWKQKGDRLRLQYLDRLLAEFPPSI